MEETQRILYRGVEMTVPHGFDEYFKIYGGDSGVDVFSKELKTNLEYCRVMYAIMNDRAEVEESYAAKLKKLSAKLISSISHERGSVAASVKAIGMSMAEESYQHVELQKLCSEKISPSLKTVIKSFETTMKNVDKQLEKMRKKYAEKQSSLKSLKKKCFQKAYECKKDTIKTDAEYYNKSLKTEAVRAELELRIYKTVAVLQSLERLRLSEIHNACVVYYNHLAACLMRTNSFINEIEPTISGASPECDIIHLLARKQQPNVTIDQPLIDYASEEMHLSMDKAVRVQNLSQYLAWARECMDTEVKTKYSLLKALQGLKPSDPESYQSIEATRNQLILSSSTQDYLEACEWKFATLLAAVEGSARPNYRFGNYIVRERDTNQQATSILRLPLQHIVQPMPCQISFLPPSPKPVTAPATHPGVAAPNGFIRAVSDYEAKRNTELTLRRGDNVYIMLPWDRVWWLAVLGNRVGEVPSQCFVDPATGVPPN